MTELPTTFGKYFLTEKLATGGMAEIYLAKLVGPGGFEKQLVIKQIHPKLTGQRHFVDLFVAEAKTLVTLAHGNIVPVYELGVIDDTYFIAMEYIDGPTLYRLTEALARREDRMDPAVAAWITAKVVEGLDYAHRKGEGVIHRDLSPRNVMLSRDGEVKLVDFGIAVTLGAADDGVELQSAPTGSFPYMSPEQVRREPLSGQTDLFSVGVLMWEMLVGHRLFARPDPDATLAAVTDGEIVPPSSERPEVPAKLDEIVMRALERDQAARWSSAADMLAALQRYLYSLEDTPGPREVGALVARYCPPETRRLPTHADPPPSEDGATPVPVPSGPRTAVIDRSGDRNDRPQASDRQQASDQVTMAKPPDGDVQPRGKPKRARTETFATNVDLKNMLERATPLVPMTALTDEDLQPRTQVPDSQASGSSSRLARAEDNRRMASVRPDTDDAVAELSSSRIKMHPEAPKLELPGRQPPSRALIGMAAIGTIALGLGAVYVFVRGRGAVLAPDAPIREDAAWYAFERDAAPGAEDAIDAVPFDASPIDAPIDASPIDARADVKDAVVRTKDAQPDAQPVIAIGTAKLVIGATPWGKVVIDGVPRGTVPGERDVSAGKHTVEIIFDPEGEPAKKKLFPITVAAGETLRLDADFTK